MKLHKKCNKHSSWLAMALNFEDFDECKVKPKITKNSFALPEYKYNAGFLVICYLLQCCITWPHAETTCNCVTTAEPNDEKTGQNKCSWAETLVWNVYGHRKFSSPVVEMGLWEVDGVSGTQGYIVWLDILFLSDLMYCWLINIRK